jgi:hypothetical protein
MPEKCRKVDLPDYKLPRLFEKMARQFWKAMVVNSVFARILVFIQNEGVMMV